MLSSQPMRTSEVGTSFMKGSGISFTVVLPLHSAPQLSAQPQLSGVFQCIA